MAKKSKLTSPSERWVHLRKFVKRMFWKKERQCVKKEISLAQ